MASWGRFDCDKPGLPFFSERYLATDLDYTGFTLL